MEAVRAFWKLGLFDFSISDGQEAVGSFPTLGAEMRHICSHAPRYSSMSSVILTGKICISNRKVCRVATLSYIYPYFVKPKRSDLQMLSKQ